MRSAYLEELKMFILYLFNIECYGNTHGCHQDLVLRGAASSRIIWGEGQKILLETSV
jgi:hypothetical protein